MEPEALNVADPADALDPARRPVIRLRPGRDGRALVRGAPWAFADEIALDRRARRLAPGTIVRLESAAGRETPPRPIGTFAFNPRSKIAARRLDDDPEAVIDSAWIARRLARAARLRTHLFDASFWRWVHAEGDGLPGVVIDRFGEAAVIQPNAAWAERLLPWFAEALAEAGIGTLVMNGTSRGRALEGLEERVELVAGRLDGPVKVPMNGAVYLADLVGGQKTGLYYDQRLNHAFAARLGRGGRMLDVFAHVGGFSLAALAAGAREALAVDASAPALTLAEAGARESGVADRFRTMRADAFEAMARLRAEGERFDLVVADPPAFAPSRAAREAGLRAYEKVARLAAGLVAPGGFLVLCSCSHAADLDAFRTASLRGIGRAGRRAQLIHTGFAGPDHPQHPQLAETGYLKALFWRLED